MPHISTHVLNTAEGKPAAGVHIDLHRESDHIASATTNRNGRTDAPLLTADTLPTGVYELTFHVETAFYDRVSVRFRVSDPDSNYHVPLLISPYGYSTYRGS